MPSLLQLTYQRPLIEAVIKNLTDYDVLYHSGPEQGTKFLVWILKWKRENVWFSIIDTTQQLRGDLIIDDPEGNIVIDDIRDFADPRDAMAHLNSFMALTLTAADLGLSFRDIPIRWSDLGRQSFRTWFDLLTGKLLSDTEMDKILAANNIRVNKDGTLSRDVIRIADNYAELQSFTLIPTHFEWEEIVYE